MKHPAVQEPATPLEGPFRIHRNRSRRGFWRRLVPLDGDGAPAPEPVGEDGHAWEEERLRAARASRALAALPAVQREAVVLFELEGYSIDEIAAFQEVSPSAVKSRLARGRDRHEARRAVQSQVHAILCGWQSPAPTCTGAEEA